MIYEKAQVEVVYFEEKELFMVVSSGQTCNGYATISSIHGGSFTCYSVTTGAVQQSDGSTPTYCSDVDPAPAYEGTLFCGSVSFCGSYVMP